MVKFILIKPNEYFLKKIPNKTEKNENLKICQENIFKLKSNYIDLDKLQTELESFVEIIDIEMNDTWMLEISKYLKLDEEHYCDVIDCYEEKDNVYQLFNVMPNEDDDIEKMPKNLFSSTLTKNKTLLYNTSILFKTNLPSKDFTAKNVDITIQDLASLIMNNYYHTCVEVKEDNSIETKFFNNDKKFIDPLNKFNILRTHHILADKLYGNYNKTLFKFNLVFTFSKNDHDKRPNEPACHLLKNIIKGDCIISTPFNELTYNDLTKEDVIKLLKIHNKDLTKQDLIKEYNKGIEIVKNKYRIIENKLRQ